MMKLRLSIGILVLVFASPAWSETLNNDSVIAMVQAGLSEDAILTKVRASEGRYSTTVEDLIKLKKSKVPDRVISAMIESEAAQLNREPIEYSNSAGAPKLPHQAGVYLLTDRNADAKMIEIEASDIAFKKSGVFLSYALTGGLVPMNSNATISGPHAKTETAQERPIFYFYFDAATQGSRSSFWQSNSVSSSMDFALVRLDIKDGTRRKRIGKFNITGSSYGVNEKDRIPFTSSELRPGVFEVIPVSGLAPGEYAFIYSPFGGLRDQTKDGITAWRKAFAFAVIDPTTDN